MIRLTSADDGPATDRRSFIQAGAAGVAVMAASLGSSGLALAGGLDQVRPYKAVIDTRYVDSLAFGREMARRGIATAALQGDVTDLWYHDLYHRWKKGPTVLAGLTDASVLFCLETLANDAGMRVAFRNSYRGAAGGPLERRTEAPEALLGLVDQAPAGAAWGRGMASVTLACAGAASAPFARGSVAVRCEAPTAAARDLTAWVIAPLKRA